MKMVMNIMNNNIITFSHNNHKITKIMNKMGKSKTNGKIKMNDSFIK